MPFFLYVNILEFSIVVSKPKLNDPCLCGSQKKFKHCCFLRKDRIKLDIQKNIKHAWDFFNRGFLEEALKLSEGVLKINPQQAESVYLSGLIFLKDGQIKRAIDYLLKANILFPKHFEVLTNLGFAYHEAGEVNLAKTRYMEALSIHPQYSNAYYNLHALYIDEGDFDQAKHCLEKIISINDNDLDAIFMLGLLHEYQEDEVGAKPYFEKIKQSTALLLARLEAWKYLKVDFKNKPIFTGSIKHTFQIAMNATKKEGLILEFGVRHGNSINQLAKLTTSSVHGFDSFEGLPTQWHNESKESYSTKGVIPEVEKNVSLYKGWFEDTLPEFSKKNPESIRLINIDCDLFSSTATILKILGSQIQSGTVLIFDEYIGNQHWKEDEFKAFQEAVTINQWKYEYLAFSFFTKQVVIKIL
jgi:tetratricopeptide (TPR) repeat protein